jgi:hypothetical protein
MLELMWGRVSLVMLALFFNNGLPTSAGVMEAVVNADNLNFVAAYIAATGIFAMLVFTPGQSHQNANAIVVDPLK